MLQIPLNRTVFLKEPSCNFFLHKRFYFLPSIEQTLLMFQFLQRLYGLDQMESCYDNITVILGIRNSCQVKQRAHMVKNNSSDIQQSPFFKFQNNRMLSLIFKILMKIKITVTGQYRQLSILMVTSDNCQSERGQSDQSPEFQCAQKMEPHNPFSEFHRLNHQGTSEVSNDCSQI